MPPDAVVSRIDGYFAPNADPEHVPPDIATMIRRQMPSEVDNEVETIRRRMLALHTAVFGGGGGEE
jgi:hypothetical protein